MNIKKEITAAKKALEIELLKAYIGARHLEMDNATITIDSTGINYWIDSHNHFYYEFSNRIEGPLMREFVLLLRYLEDEDACKGKSVIDFMISYFQEYPDSLIGLIQGMIEIDEELGEHDDSRGFKEWLIGDSYRTGGNARHYKRDDLYALR